MKVKNPDYTLSLRTAYLFLRNILADDITVEPVLSGHPQGMAKSPLNTGCTKYRSTVKMPFYITVNDVVYSLCIKALKKSLTWLKVTATITWFEKN